MADRIGSDRIGHGRGCGEYLPEQADWLVPTMVQLELARWLKREVGEDRADKVIAFTQVCQVVPLDTEIALAAAVAFLSGRMGRTVAAPLKVWTSLASRWV